MTDDLDLWLDRAGPAEAGVVDLFAGPGGWEVGLRTLDPAAHARTLGVELDASACATRTAAGHLTLTADVAALDPAPWVGLVDLLIASPPCQAFAEGGHRAGTDDAVDAYLDGIYDEGWRCDRLTAWHRWAAGVAEHRASIPPPGQATLFPPLPHPGPPPPDPRGDLVVEVARWASVLRPRAILCEQVPGVAPIWHRLADEILAPAGYSTAVEIVNAAGYGVPQTRRRAILVARRDGRPATIPAPTHPHPIAVAGAIIGSGGRSINTGRDWKPGGARADAQTVATSGPAPTVTTVPGQWRWQDGDNLAEPVTVEQAARLQTFPAGYPWQGRTAADRWRQVGNAIPPRLAAAILATVLPSGPS